MDTLSSSSNCSNANAFCVSILRIERMPEIFCPSCGEAANSTVLLRQACGAPINSAAGDLAQRARSLNQPQTNRQAMLTAGQAAQGMELLLPVQRRCPGILHPGPGGGRLVLPGEPTGRIICREDRSGRQRHTLPHPHPLPNRLPLPNPGGLPNREAFSDPRSRPDHRPIRGRAQPANTTFPQSPSRGLAAAGST